jgi:hypothetical protein
MSSLNNVSVGANEPGAPESDLEKGAGSNGYAPQMHVKAGSEGISDSLGPTGTSNPSTAGVVDEKSGLRSRTSHGSHNGSNKASATPGLTDNAANAPSTSGNSGVQRYQEGDSSSNTAFDPSRPPSTSQRGRLGKLPNAGDGDDESTPADFEGMGGRPWSTRSYLYQFAPFRGMYHDVKIRLPYYISDWTLAFKPNNMYRVVAASVRMYFVK